MLSPKVHNRTLECLVKSLLLKLDATPLESLRHGQGGIPSGLGQRSSKRLLKVGQFDSRQALWPRAHITATPTEPLPVIQAHLALLIQRQPKEFGFGSLAAADNARSLRLSPLLSFLHTHSAVVSSGSPASSSLAAASFSFCSAA